ncbi:creatininase [Escherichia coli]|uniref:creatininase n=1 Tax=Escherichia coli TaxID=562 RepID=UPI0032B45B0F
MGYSAAKVSTHLELEKNRGYWRAKGFDRDSCQLSLKIERTRGRWRFYDENHKQVKAEPILYTLLKTII